MNRHLLLIGAFILGVLALGVLLYVMFFRGSIVTNTNSQQNQNVNGTFPDLNGNVNRGSNTNGVLPTINGSNANRSGVATNTAPAAIAGGGDTNVDTLVSGNASDIVVDASGNVRYYDKATGQFYKLDANGTVVPLSGVKFPEAEAVVWSGQKNEVIVSFPDDSKVYYNFDTKKQATLPKEGEDFSFAPAGGQIAFKFNAKNANDRFLVVSNPDGTSITPVEPLGENGNKVDVQWSPNNQVVATYAPGLDGGTQEVFFVGKNGENFKSTVTDGRGFEGSWSPDGQRMLYSTYSAGSSYNPSLHIVDAQGDSVGGNNRPLDIATWSDKCTFSKAGTTLYCAVPDAGTLPSGSGIYRNQAASAPDSFYVVDLTTGAKSLLANPVGTDGSRRFSAVNMTLSPDEKTLYFTDAPTGRVLTLKLR
ncbi:MAG: hypothetical protein AAB515_01255 [Patescibacteria group bacterium]